MDKVNEQAQGKLNNLVKIISKIGNKISSLFEPEEVEVTFTERGNTVNYTYTKVEHKRVA